MNAECGCVIVRDRRFPRASRVKPMKIYTLAVFVGVSSCAFGQGTVFNATPSREFGQKRLSPVSSGNPNLVEGREFFLPQSIALDNSSNPPAIYVADTGNNRVLGWRNIG